MKSDLPASLIADKVNEELRNCSSLVITAPPGAGKSTLLPLTILEEIGDSGKILMLEPRRLAARQIAERMAMMLGEEIGKTVGYRVRFDNCVSNDTRIEVITEGILTRMLVADPTLDGVAVVIFDEFHERSLTSDVALALTRESQCIIRPELKIVLMSATIDTSSICKALNAKLIECEGRQFPVEIKHVESRITETSRPDEIAQEVAKAIITAHNEEDGDILAFLPGQTEILRCEQLLANSLSNTHICPLYGLMNSKQQRLAIAPSKEGERKVVLATPIAETSLTIQGVRIVIDSGLCRKLIFSSQSALSHLTTVRISMDMAIQRTGRAGRLESGVCYRLWSLATEQRMEENRKPEILEADLAPMVLDISAWGENNPNSLSWLTPPPAASVANASKLLEMLGAISSKGMITEHGKSLASLPCHPRIAQMLITATSPELKSLACNIAAILEEKDPLNAPNDADINTRLISLLEYKRERSKPQSNTLNSFALISRISEQYHRLVRVEEKLISPNPYDTGKLLASAFPERIAKAVDNGCGKYKLANGDFTSIDNNDMLSSYDWLAVATLGKRIFLASPLHPKDLDDMARTIRNLSWDNKQGVIIAREEKRIGRLILSSKPIADISDDEIIKTICEAAPKYGTSMFDFNDKVQNLQRRIAAVATWHTELELPDVSTEAVLARTSDWLTTTNINKADMQVAIWSLLTYKQQETIERLAPTHITMPTGSKIKVEYRVGAELPIIRVRLQECFGMQDTPRINGGKLPVLMELLSPGFKPVQLTQDLHSFWEHTYFEVRKELRRRYPKHSWPDNPTEAVAVRK